jgi:putative oxidoreductase
MKSANPYLAAIPLRLTIGIILLITGYSKINHMPETIAFFAKHGFPIPIATAWFIALLEFFGAIALILGLFVRLLGALYALEFIIASVWVQLPATGYAQGRLLFMLIAGGFALYLIGPGPLSIDSRWLEK